MGIVYLTVFAAVSLYGLIATVPGLVLMVVLVVLSSGLAVLQDARSLAVLAMTVGGVLWLVLPAVYVAASNLALVPLTGQNMPFLGLNSWADVVLVSGLATVIVFSLAALREPPAEGGAA